MAQKSAWFVLQRLRYMLKAVEQRPMGSPGPVEIDECYLGPNPKTMHSGQETQLKRARKPLHKQDRCSWDVDRSTREVRATVVPEITRETLQAQILKHCGCRIEIYTDAHAGYDRVAAHAIHSQNGHSHERICAGRCLDSGHRKFLVVFEKDARGTYVCVEAFHLDLYLNEQVYRFNNRINKNDGERFRKALSMIGDRRLTWNRLTGKEGLSY